jgi:Mce-associated membrane protein
MTMRTGRNTTGADTRQSAEDESVDIDAADQDERNVSAEDTGGETDKSENSSAEAESDAAKPNADSDKRRSHRWIRASIRWAAGAVFVAFVAVAGYESWLLFQQHQNNLASGQALSAARKYAVTLTSTDPNAIDQNFTDILSGATGDFKDTYTKASSRLRKMLIDNKVATQGTVIDSAVKSATTNKVEILLFVRQSVTNSASPEPRTDITAVTMTMEKVGDRWLASKVILPAEQGKGQ